MARPTIEQAAQELNTLIPDTTHAAIITAGRPPHASQLGPGTATSAHMPVNPRPPSGMTKCNANLDMRTRVLSATLR